MRRIGKRHRSRAIAGKVPCPTMPTTALTGRIEPTAAKPRAGSIVAIDCPRHRLERPLEGATRRPRADRSEQPKPAASRSPGCLPEVIRPRRNSQGDRCRPGGRLQTLPERADIRPWSREFQNAPSARTPPRGACPGFTAHGSATHHVAATTNAAACRGVSITPGPVSRRWLLDAGYSTSATSRRRRASSIMSVEPAAQLPLAAASSDQSSGRSSRRQVNAAAVATVGSLCQRR